MLCVKIFGAIAVFEFYPVAGPFSHWWIGSSFGRSLVLIVLEQDVLEAIIYDFSIMVQIDANRSFNSASKLGVLLEKPTFHFRFDLTNTTGTPRSFGFLSWCRCVDTLDCFRQIIWNISVPNQSSCLGFKSYFLGEVKHHLDLMDLNPNSWDFGNPESKWS